MPRLLIVDDDPVDRELAGRALRSIEGLEILEAADGQEAIEACLAEPPDLVLTDLRMPRLDGLALVREIGERLPMLPVILMTAQGSEHVAVEALEAGAASYVPKSDLAELLGEAVEHALGISAARRERTEILRYLRSSEARFEIASDPTLISPLVAYLQDSLERVGFADDRVRSQVGTALVEALSNAVIHGNLEVSSDLRKESSDPYHEQIAERREAEPWSSRRVTCVAEHRAGGVRYVIRDEGAGFDRSGLPDPTHPESMLMARGRGLFLMHAFMDEVEYNESGNEVRMTKQAPAGELEPAAGSETDS